MTVQTTSATLLKLARKRCECLMRVHKYGVGQLALIEQGDMGRLLTLLAEKNRELEAFSNIEKELAPFRDLPSEAHSWPSESERQECQKLLAESEALVKQIMEQEKASEAQLVAKRANTSEQLQQLQGANNASAAYGQHGQGGLSRLDLSSGE